MGNRANRVRATRAKTLLVVLVAMGAMLLTQVSGLAVHDIFLFELDGDAYGDGDPTNGPDWDSVYADQTGINVFLPDPPESDVSYFKGGGSKDIEDVPEWRYAATPSAPDKDEITNAYATASFDPDPVDGGLVLYFGADRYSNDGDAAIGFWFFQNQVTTTTDSSNGGFEFDGQHTQGDVFVVSDFTNGGTVENIFVFQWDEVDGLVPAFGGEPGTDCDTTPFGDDVCANVNDFEEPSPWPYSPKPNVGVDGTFPERAFFEGGVNLSALLPGGFGCFSSFLAETRSSQEPTAQLKDFALGQFEICAANIQIEADDTNEVGDSHTFTVTVNKEVANTEMPADDGTEVTVDFTSANGTTIPSQICLTSGGTCEVTINSVVGDTITAHASASVEVLADDIIDVETDGVDDNSGDAVKTYVDAVITIEADATNEVGDPHTFTVTVEEAVGTDVFSPSVGAIVDVTLTDSNGAANAIDTETCSTGTDASGQCTITFTSDTAGVVTGHAAVELILGPDAITVNRETDGLETTPGSGTSNSDDAVKTFVDAYITIEADATNEVGEPHTFTVTVFEDDGSGSGYAPANGEIVTFDSSGSAGAITVNGTCATNATGAHASDGDGECTIEVASDVAGQITVSASSDVAVGGLSVSVTTDSSVRPGGQANSGPATKTWVDARISIEPDATNEVGDDHTFIVHVEKNLGAGWVDADGESVTVTLTDSNGAVAVESANTCAATDVDGECSVTFSSDTPGVTTGSASVSLALGETDGSTVDRSTDGVGDNSDDAVKTWVDARISIEPDATNEVGDDHTFIVHVEKNLGAGWVDADGESVTVTLTDSNGAVAVESANTCAATDVDGECSVTFSSDTPGVTTGSASVSLALGETDGSTVDRSTDGVGDNSDDAVKTWVDARISIEPDATNEVGDDHTFIVHVEKNLGAGWVDADGESVTVTLTDSNGAVAVESANTCAATDVDGECSVTFSSDTPGVTTGSASVSLALGETDGSTVDRSTDGVGDNSDDAVKTWVDARISIEPDATNEVGDDHTFIVHVEKNLGAGWVDADGESVTVTLTDSNGAVAVESANTCAATDVDGECSVTFSSDTPGVTTGSASVSLALGETDGSTVDRSTDGVGDNSDDAVKTWVDARISIEPDATNEVGDDHTFIVHVEKNLGAGWVDADGESVTVTLTDSNGAVAVQSSNSCTTGGFFGGGTDVNGECSVTFSSDTPGVTTGSASVSLALGETDGSTVDRSTDGVGDNSDDAVKTWVDARISITPTETNEVGVAHEFTVHVEKNPGDGWVNAAGEAVTVTYAESNGADAQSDDTCDTLADGTCVVSINSDNAGQIVATASVELDMGETDGSTVDRSTDGVDDNSGPATKTYVDAYITITADGINRVGEDHTFTVTVWKDTGDGAGYVAAEGETVSAEEISGFDPAITGGTCTTGGTDAAGQCTVVVDSDVTGDVTVSASVTVTMDTVDVSVETDGSARPNGTLNSDPVTKTWVDAWVTIEPDGVNEVGEDHDFNVTVHYEDAGTTTTVLNITTDVTPAPTSVTDGCADSLDWDTSVAGEVSCVLTISSDDVEIFTAGVDASVEFALGGESLTIDITTDGLGDNSDDAVKRYVDAAVSIEDDGVNEVGEDHTFTITVTTDAPAGTTVDYVNITPTGTAGTSDCVNDGTSTALTCEVTVSSDAVATATVGADVVVLFSDADGNSDTVARSTDSSTTPSGLTNSDDAVKRWVDAAVSIEDDGVNEVGEDHTFTITVTTDAPAGTTVDYVNITPTGTAGTSDCVNDGTSTALTCEVTVSSDAVATATVGADVVVLFSDADGNSDTVARSTDSSTTPSGLTNSDDAVKRWVDAAVSIEDDGVNEVGEDHTFTITVTTDAPAGTTVDYVNITPTGTAGTSDCVNDGTSTALTCEVTVSSDAVATATVGADVVVLFSDADGNSDTVARSTDSSTTPSGLTNSDDAVKRWVDAAVSIEDDGVNEVGEDHTFTITVTTDAPAGTTVDYVNITPTGTAGTSDCVNDGTSTALTCEVTVSSDAVATATVGADVVVLFSDADGNSDTVARSTDSSTTPSGLTNSDDAVKRWVDAAVSIEDDGVNEVGEDHTFTITVTTDAPAGTTVDYVNITPTGTAGTSDCVNDGTSTALTCEVTVSSDAVATATVGADVVVLFSDADGNSDTVARSTDSSTTPSGLTNSDDAVKRWVDAAVSIEDDGVNEVGEDHTFTITVTTDAPAGTTVDYVNITPTGTAGTSDCVNDGTSTALTCEVTVSSDAVATATVGADVVVLFSDADGNSDTVARSTDSSTTPSGLTNSDDAVKRWVDAAVSIEDDGVNEVGEDHTFTITVTTDAPAGTTVDYVNITPTGTAGTSDCVNDGTSTALTCEVTVSSDAVATATVGADVVVLFSDADGNSDTVARSTDSSTTPSGLTNSDDAVKRWVDAKIEITPDGVNEVGDQHDFAVTVTVDPGDTTFTGDVTGYVVLPPAPYVMSDCGALTFVANVATCTVSINSASAGVFEAGATAVVTFSDADGNSDTVTRSTDGSTTVSGLENSDEATKQYVDSYVTIAEDALNGITEDHTFTVTVYGNDGIAAADGGDGADGFTPYAGATVSAEALLGNTAGSITGGTCVTAGVTDAAGTCTVVVSSADEGFISVKATSMLTINGVTLSRMTDSSETTTEVGGSGVFNSGPATKTWVDASLRWFKVDQDNNPLGGATFEVTRTFDRFGTAVTEAPMVVLDNGPLDADPAAGSFYLVDLVFGTYQVEETIAPAGYLGSDLVLNVAITDLDDSDATVNNGPDVVITEAWVNTIPFEGCTPGFWGGGNGMNLWDIANDPDFDPSGANPYDHSTVFGTFFKPSGEIQVDMATMLTLVDTGGGSLNEQKAARSLVAAYLNASHDGVYYAFTQAELIAMWEAAVDSGDDAEFLALHILLDTNNRLGCGL